MFLRVILRQLDETRFKEDFRPDRDRDRRCGTSVAGTGALGSGGDPTGGVVGRDVLDRLVAGLEQHPQVANMSDEICDWFR